MGVVVGTGLVYIKCTSPTTFGSGSIAMETGAKRSGANDDVFVDAKIVGQKIKKQSNGKEMEVGLEKRRFLILGIFCLYSMSSAFQWIEYAIITDVIVDYYNVSSLAVYWTSMIYMASYIPLMFVATWMLDTWGLRRVVLFGATLNAAGALIKVFSVQPHLFPLSFLGQTVAACAQSFILEIPPKIGSVWFGPSEVSTATAIGVFGNQLGVAIGFLLPPAVVTGGGYISAPKNSSNSSDYNNSTFANQSSYPIQPSNDEIVASQLRTLFIGSAAVCCVVLLLIIIIFRDQPHLPPSMARKLSVAAEHSNKEMHSNSLKNYGRSIKVLVKDVPFLLLFVTYGINTGTYYAIGTLLNAIMMDYYSHDDAGRQIGEIGLTMVVAGLVGSVLCGFILDMSKLFKLTTVLTYAFSMAFMFIFTFTLNYYTKIWLDYVTIGLLGFFMTGYLPIGFEFAAEITYPESEATSAGFLNVSAQIFGILFTLTAAEFQKISAFVANIFMSIALFIGLILTVFIKEDLKRQRANQTPSDRVADTPSTEEQELLAGNNGDTVARLTSNSSYYSTGGKW